MRIRFNNKRALIKSQITLGTILLAAATSGVAYSADWDLTGVGGFTGNWSSVTPADPGWSTATPPNAVGATARFASPNYFGLFTVTVDTANVTVGTINLDVASAAGSQLALNGNKITLNQDGAGPGFASIIHGNTSATGTVISFANSELVLNDDLHIINNSSSTSSKGAIIMGASLTGTGNIVIDNNQPIMSDQFTNTKTPGGIRFIANSTFIGTTTLNKGAIAMAAPNSLGTLASNTFFLGTATASANDVWVSLQSGGLLPNNVVVNSGSTGILTLASVANDDLASSTGFTGSVTLNHDLQIVSNTVTVTSFAFSGQVTGTKSPIIASRTVTFSNSSNDYTGDTIINQGALLAANGSAIPDGTGKGNVVLNGTVAGSTAGGNSSTIGFAGLFLGGDETINGLSGFGVVKPGSTTTTPVTVTLASHTLSVGNNNATSTFDGIMADQGAANKLSLTKIGNGTLTLTGPNVYTGTTTVSQGTLLVNGTHAAAGNYTIASGGTLGGSGSINSNVIVQSGGNIAPGNSAGILNVNANLDLSAGGNYAWQLGALSAVTPGTDFDSITVGGDTILGGTSKVSLDFSVMALALRPGQGNTYWNAGHTFKILDTNTNTGTTNFSSVVGAAGPGSWTTAVGTLGDAGDILLRYVAGDISSSAGVGIPDAFVGGDDLNVILGHWGQFVATGNLTLGDLSGPTGVPDGFVGGDDLNIILANWGKGPAAVGTGFGGGGAAAAITAVPEPSTFVLAGLGLVSLALIRKQRAK